MDSMTNIYFEGESLPLFKKVRPTVDKNGFAVLEKSRTAETIQHMAFCLEHRIPFCFDESLPNQTVGSIQTKPAAVFQTSGTSGVPKAVPVSSAQIASAVNSSAKNFSVDDGCTWLLCLPLHHTGGANVVFKSVLGNFSLDFLSSFDPQKVARLLRSEPRIQAVSLVPTQLYRLLKVEDFAVHEGFKAVLLGGGPCDPTILALARSRGIPVLFSYGMTETCGQVCAQPFSGRFGDDVHTVGRPLEGISVTITDAFHEPVPAGTKGLIWVKGNQIFSGYLGGDSPDSGRFNNGFGFLTLDWGCLDEYGRLRVIARRDDLINTGGEKVAPFYVESVLMKSGLIEEAAVVGRPHAEWGQEVVAVVSGNQRVEPALRKFVKNEIPGYMCPKTYIWNIPIPKTEGGKVRRALLRAQVG